MNEWVSEWVGERHYKRLLSRLLLDWTCTEFDRAPIRTQIIAGFSPFGCQTQVQTSCWNVQHLATCANLRADSWIRLAGTLHKSVRKCSAWFAVQLLRWLASSCDSVWSELWATNPNSYSTSSRLTTNTIKVRRFHYSSTPQNQKIPLCEYWTWFLNLLPLEFHLESLPATRCFWNQLLV